MMLNMFIDPLKNLASYKDLMKAIEERKSLFQLMGLLTKI